jgi:hypothetical protein
LRADLRAFWLVCAYFPSSFDAPAYCCAFAGDRLIVAGDAGERVHFLLLEG